MSVARASPESPHEQGVSERAVDTRFLEQPAFSVFEPSVRERLAACRHFPTPSELRALTLGIPNSSPLAFEFELEDAARVRAAGGFDRFIADTSRIPTRAASYHDLFGALIWLHFPELKSALHRIQLDRQGARRSARENAATHCDESGVLLVSSDPKVFEELAGLNWPSVFWERRAALLESTRFLCFGHGLLDALRVPHPRLLGMALFARVSPARLRLTASELRVYLDRALSLRLPEFLVEPARLQPLPVLGVPSWSDQQTAAFYDDTSYFRRARQKSQSARPASWIELD
jgi:hypothetical protein